MRISMRAKAADAGRMQKLLWITWERQRRNRALSAKFNAELVEVVVSGGRVRRYVRSAVTTIGVLRAHMPKVLFVQSPSIVLALLATTIGRIWSDSIVIDAHNAGIFPFEGRIRLFNRIARLILGWADLVIVSNDELRGQLGLADVVVLQDPLMDHENEDCAWSVPECFERSGGQESFVVTCVASWARDEPMGQVIDAAKLLPKSVQIRITGRAPRQLESSRQLPENVRLLGFVDEQAYLRELRDAHVVIVLTNREACLTCGAYEAVSLGKPLILSATKALQSYFGQAAIYTKNQAASIAAAIQTAQMQHCSMVAHSGIARQSLASDWERRFAKVRALPIFSE